MMNDTPAMADLIQTIDERIRLALRETMTRVVYGVVDTVDTAAKTCAVFIEAEATSSPDIAYSIHEPAAGALVRVALDPKGDRYIQAIEGSVTEGTLARLRLTSTTDLSLASTGHALQIGASSGTNLAMDNNEIAARNNGAAEPLHINADGGDVDVAFNALPITLSANGWIELEEQGSSVGNAGTNKLRLYARLNASNKTELAVRFQSGGAVLIAAEP